MPFNKQNVVFFKPDLTVSLKGKEVIVVNLYLNPRLYHLIPKDLPEKCEGCNVVSKRGHSPGETTYKGLKAVSSFHLLEMLESSGFHMHHVVGFEQRDKDRYVIRFVFVSEAMDQPSKDPWFWDVDGKGRVSIETIIDGMSSTFFLNNNKGNEMISIELVAPEFCYFPHFAVVIKQGMIGVKSLPWQKDKEQNRQTRLTEKNVANPDEPTHPEGRTYSI